MSPLVAARAAAAARGYGWGLSAGGPSGGFEAIATVTAAGGETSLSFSSIPQNFVALQIRGIYRDNWGSASAVTMAVTFNSDTGRNYASHLLRGDGELATAAGYAGQNQIALWDFGIDNTVASGTFAAGIVDIHDYASTSKATTLRCFAGSNDNSTSSNRRVTLSSGLWTPTTAVSSVQLKSVYTSFAAGTTFALYGIKGAS